jgi:uncharacterized protein (DUF433 family)
MQVLFLVAPSLVYPPPRVCCYLVFGSRACAGFGSRSRTIVALIAEGQTTQDILALYRDLDADDIREALLCAAEAVRERDLPLAAGE